MRAPVDISIRLGAIGAALWAAFGTALYALFIAVSFCGRGYAIYPAMVVVCYLMQVRFVLRPLTASPVAAWLASAVTCGVAALGGAYGFVDATEGEPGPWDWMNGQSLLGSALLASIVVLQTVRRAPNHPAAGNAGFASWLRIKRYWPGVPEPRRSAYEGDAIPN